MGIVEWNLAVLAAVVSALACAAGLVVVARRRGAASGDTPTAPLSRGEGIVVAIVGGGALVAIPLSLFSLVASAVRFSTERVLRIDALPLGNASEPGFLESVPTVDAAAYESVWVEIADLPAGPRWMLWAEAALPMLLALILGIGIAWLATALLRGAPFTRALPAALGVAAIVIVGAGLGTQVLGSIARGEVITFLGSASRITAHDDGNGAEEGFAFVLSLDLSPIGWGLGIALVSAAFAIGTRLQRDTKGLV